ncbi:MAG: ribbon-helix-helix domain-containing protein [Candidatus Heimdallarchaeaceae archaeon]
MRKRIITFKVPDRMLKEMNQMMSEGNFDSRSELVRAALAEFIIREYFMGNVPEDKADLFTIE